LSPSLSPQMATRIMHEICHPCSHCSHERRRGMDAARMRRDNRRHEVLAAGSTRFFSRLGSGAGNLCCGFSLSEVRLRPDRRYAAGRHDHPPCVRACAAVVACRPFNGWVFCRRRCGDLGAVVAVSRLACGHRLGLLRLPPQPPIARSNTCAMFSAKIAQARNRGATRASSK
jgi:hypothetical protein